MPTPAAFRRANASAAPVEPVEPVQAAPPAVPRSELVAAMLVASAGDLGEARERARRLEAAAIDGLPAVRALLDRWGLFGGDRIATLAHFRARGAV